MTRLWLGVTTQPPSPCGSVLGGPHHGAGRQRGAPQSQRPLPGLSLLPAPAGPPVPLTPAQAALTMLAACWPGTPAPRPVSLATTLSCCRQVPSWGHGAVCTSTPSSVLPTRPSPAAKSEHLCTLTRGPCPRRNPLWDLLSSCCGGTRVLACAPTPHAVPTQAPKDGGLPRLSGTVGAARGGYLYAFLETGRGSNLKKMMHMSPKGGLGSTDHELCRRRKHVE